MILHLTCPDCRCPLEVDLPAAAGTYNVICPHDERKFVCKITPDVLAKELADAVANLSPN